MSPPNGRVLWKANSSRHDWRDGTLVRRFIAHATALGLLGSVEAVESDRVADPSRLVGQTGNAAATALLGTAAPSGRIELRIRGRQPAPWELFCDIYPFDADDGWVDGVNTVWLEFDRSRVPDHRASEALRLAFAAVHTPADTEYAVIHPYDHWSDFAEAHYERPVTIGPMFKGVFWANYLGPGHLDQFDPARLQGLGAFQEQWFGSSALLVVATPELVSADASATEPLLLRLTQRFRDALRDDSR